jgi:hypothetical protein
MTADRQPRPSSIPIRLDSEFARTRGHQELEQAIRRIVCSVRFEIVDKGLAFRLLGPEMSYHHVDPHLPMVLASMCNGLAIADILSYRSSTQYFDFYLEDSWTGYFIAKQFEQSGPRPELLLIHLDDHTDMMPTLLGIEHGRLIDPTSGGGFNPLSMAHWDAAIRSGAVNIGNYITPFFHTGTRCHIRHLNNASAAEGLSSVAPSVRCYDLVPHRQFASIEKSRAQQLGRSGSYLASSRAEVVLADLPDVRAIVHIDLDYFINDFNGSFRGRSYVPDMHLHAVAENRMDRFFASLAQSAPVIDRWMIGASPGFCSAYHWQWLLEQLQERIRSFEAQRALERGPTHT